jgi:hypothetical protein
MTATLVKEKAHRLVDQMPENSTWDDLIHEIYVREAIEQGLVDSKAGRTMEVGELRAQYGLQK